MKADLSQTQFDAWVSIGFNAGRSALMTSPVVKSIEGSNYEQAAEDVKTFRVGGGNKSRRLLESKLFASGIYEDK